MIEFQWTEYETHSTPEQAPGRRCWSDATRKSML
jgi:hypothetical protein